MNTLGCVSSTTANGIPYGGPPKSGWRFVLPAFIEASHCELCGFTGSFEMSVFQMLSAGNTVQFVPGGGRSGGPAANVGGIPRARATAVAATIDRIRDGIALPFTSALRSNVGAADGVP